MSARSCGIIVTNKLVNTEFLLLDYNLDHGELTADYPQPKGVPANSIMQFSTESDGFLTGTQGSATFYPHTVGTPLPATADLNPNLYITIGWDVPYEGTNSYNCNAPRPYAISFGNGVDAPIDTLYTAQASVGYTITGQSGVNTCVEGYVWRDAFPGDNVCVLPAARQQAADQNAAASAHKASGSTNCLPGYVWREAGKGDDVCVTPAERDLAAQQNAAAKQHTL